jgi:GT2 family glycosyltransferase
MKKSSIIIASWNRKSDLLETLESLKLLSLKDIYLEVVVVDNGSTDGSDKAISNFISCNSNTRISWKLIKINRNTGFCEGNNVGIKYSLNRGTDYIILLNNDVYVNTNLVSKLICFADKHKNAGAVTPKIYFAKGYEYHKNRYSKSDLGKVFWCAGGSIDWSNVYCNNRGVDEIDKGQYDNEGEVDFASGCCILFPSEVLNKIGLLDERYFAYLEDADISLRIFKAGYRVFYTPDTCIWHKVSQSSSIGSELNDYFITRNRLIFGLKYASWRAKFALLRESIRFIFSGRKWQKIGVVDFYLGKFKKGSWK